MLCLISYSVTFLSLALRLGWGEDTLVALISKVHPETALFKLPSVVTVWVLQAECVFKPSEDTKQDVETQIGHQTVTNSALQLLSKQDLHTYTLSRADYPRASLTCHLTLVDRASDLRLSSMYEEIRYFDERTAQGKASMGDLRTPKEPAVAIDRPLQASSGGPTRLGQFDEGVNEQGIGSEALSLH